METDNVIASNSEEKSNEKRRSLIRKRPVSFGISRNYHGNVYTISKDEQSVGEKAAIQSAPEVNRRIVAMIDVPPEHVPEGFLNLIRSHRGCVEHVRVLIADSDDEDDAEEKDAKEDVEIDKNNFGLDDHENLEQRRDRTYLILVQLFREDDAALFVEDLDGKPYIAFDDRDTCHIERVSHLEIIDPISGKNDSSTILSGQPKDETQQPMDRKSSKDQYQSLPLFHLNFGIPMMKNAKKKAIAQDIKGKQNDSSMCGKVSANGEDYKINCAVCLEDLGLEEKKLDDINDLLTGKDKDMPAVCIPVSKSQPSLLTTVCNHTFHLDCLEQCTGPCPVCRYDHSGLNETLSQCHVCGTTERNYVCLICGVVSCGIPRMAEAVAPAAAAAASSSTASETTPSRFYTSSHAGQHYQETLHAYALDTETQHVYDFCGQGYVHRLVQNKEDGKLVEVNDPRQTSAFANARPAYPGLSDAQEDEVVHRKLEGAAEQYNNLLKDQLQQQRAYYEERLDKMKREFSVEHQRAKAQDLLSVLRQEKKQVNQRLTGLQRRKVKVSETISFLSNMNESLESNKVALKHQIQQAARERNESKDMIRKSLPELNAKVEELTKQLIESMDE